MWPLISNIRGFCSSSFFFALIIAVLPLLPSLPVDAPYALFDADGGGAVLLTKCLRTIDIDLGREASPALALASWLGEFEVAAGRGEWIALAADYALGGACEPAVRDVVRGPQRLRAWVFEEGQRLGAAELDALLTQYLSTLDESQRVAGVAELAPLLDGGAYVEQVQLVRRWIADGECYQINLTFPLSLRVYGAPLALYAHLRARQPVRYGAFISAGEAGGALLSLSPELFFERQGPRVVTRPMKGTAPRGVDPADDALRREALQASAKERAENVMIVDLLRNDLGRLAAPGAVRVEALCETEPYPTLWQMVSTVAADLPGVTLGELFAALFPCGSITGAPKIRAMQLISEIEAAPRGVYTGALGYLAPGGDCRFNVAIRTLEVARDGRARLGVGSGIVIDADPEREYAECLLKARFLTGFDPGFALIETLRLENGVFPRLEGHLARLSSSARDLGFFCDLAGCRAALLSQVEHYPRGVFRVRLTLSHSGRCTLTVVPQPELPPSVCLAVLAKPRLPEGDYLRRHKTTVRSVYDSTLQALAATPEVFDAIFFNARGEVCEGARSTVFVEQDGVLLTPPVACGLLPGVLRAELLASGRAAERVLSERDLRDASAIFLGNALRGLIRVRLQT